MLEKTAAPKPSNQALFRLYTSRQGRITEVGEKPHSLSVILCFMGEFEAELFYDLPDVFGDGYIAEERETLRIQSRVFGLKIDMDHGLSMFDTQTGECWALGMDFFEYGGTRDPEIYRPGARLSAMVVE